MLYNKDPVLPFEIAGKVNHTIDDDSPANNLINTVEKLKRYTMPFLKCAQKNS